MSTARQRAANKENAKKSTGPVTPEGKAIASRNSVSAGFNTTVTFFLDHEKKEDFLQLLDDFTNQYQPVNPTEQVLVERMGSPPVELPPRDPPSERHAIFQE